MLEVHFKGFDNYATDALTQWDTNQKIKITGLDLTDIKTPTLLFSNRVKATAEPVIGTIKDNAIICDIPNGLLTEYYPILIYVRVTKSGTTNTIAKIKIAVIPAKKPDDYIFIENIAIMTIPDNVVLFENTENDYPEYVTLDVMNEAIKKAIEDYDKGETGGGGEPGDGTESGDITILKSITSDGESYIDTGIIPDNENYRYEYGLRFGNDIANDTIIWGADGYASNDTVAYHRLYTLVRPKYLVKTDWKGSRSEYSTYDGTGMNTDLATQTGHIVATANRTILYLDKEHTKLLDGIRYKDVTPNANKMLPIIPIYLFWVNRVDSAFVKSYEKSVWTLYYFKVYDDTNNTLLHELLPAKNSTGKIGLYDTVSGKFLKNLGTGNFSYEEVEEVIE